MEQIKRLDYVDAIKGFAILLVVMGHILACSYGNFYEALASNAQGTMLWKIIYSFHMPLFMFCSGFVFYKSRDFFSTKNTFSLLVKRFKGLMIPYTTMGLISHILIGRFFIYWFLYCLFVFYLLTLIVEWIMFRFKWWTLRVDSIFLGIASFLFMVLAGKFGQFQRLPLLDVGHFSLYFWFVLGIVSRRHAWHRILQSRNLIFSSCLFLFFSLILIKFSSISLPLLNRLIPFTAIVVVLYYFQVCSKQNYVFALLKKMGVHSLEIYVLHIFFYISLPWIGGVLDSLKCRTSLVLQLVYSLLASSIIIAICFAVISVVSKSSLLNRILFGK